LLFVLHIRIQIGFLSLISGLLTGCSITTANCYLTGNKHVVQADHVVDIAVSTENLSDVEHTFRGFAGQEANCFTLTFSGRQGSESIESLNGSYQRYSEPTNTLEIVYLKNTTAVVVPRSDILAKTTSKIVEHVGYLKVGRYKMDIHYHLNGRDYSCHFDVNYHTSSKPELHGIWELKDVN
jgi:hypothetical protein